MQVFNFKYRSIAFLMAFLVFSTSVGVSVDMHFCQGVLRGVSFFGETESCMPVAEATEECKNFEEKQTLKQKKCCENRLTHFQADQDQRPVDFALELPQFLQDFTVAYFSTLPQNTVSENCHVAFSLYEPPIIFLNIPVRFQSFLI